MIPWSSSSSRKRGSIPASNGELRSRRAQKPWMVEIQAPSSSRASSGRPRSTSAARMRLRSSAAALRVYVITRIDATSMPSSTTWRTNRSTSTVVLPVPAPAETKTRPRVAIARCCSAFTPTIYALFTRHIVQRSHHAGHPSSPFGSWRTSPARIRSASPRAVSFAPSTSFQNCSSSR